ncbi:hypothetical protein ARMGADRAFT_1074193 [Armillaria gallica]|uniref:Uncharacterized protein n=1 Tax=Armillaria gallica TaxID=47427 RepID=A0A2H3EDH8_ARMGA|nr:hypothetical protein ARMGADRAFT_1074193 [Armillaria gallica]
MVITPIPWLHLNALIVIILSQPTYLLFTALADEYQAVSHLDTVMVFLYSIYIILYAILSSVLGDIIDEDFSATGNIKASLWHVAG